MKVLRTLGCAAAGILGLTTATMAADFTAPAVSPVAAVEVATPSFSWDRFYVGAFAGGWIEVPPPGDNYFRTGVIAGRNFTVADRIVLGVEGTLGFYDTADPYLELYGFARAGVLITDNVFLYTLAGIGLETDIPFDPDYALMLGGGAEVAVGANLSLRADALFWREFGDVFDFLSVTGGVVWHLGR